MYVLICPSCESDTWHFGDVFLSNVSSNVSYLVVSDLLEKKLIQILLCFIKRNLENKCNEYTMIMAWVMENVVNISWSSYES